MTKQGPNNFIRACIIYMPLRQEQEIDKEDYIAHDWLYKELTWKSMFNYCKGERKFERMG